MTPAPLTGSSAEITSRWRPSDFPACCLSPGSAKEERRSLKGLCRKGKLQENEMFQNKMKMLPASKRGERLVSKKAKQQVKEIK